MTSRSLKRADREIMPPQIGIGPLPPDPEQRPIQCLPQQIIALAHRDADTLAEITALDEGPSGKGATTLGIRAVDPEPQRDRITENEVDLATAQRGAQRLVIG